MSAQTTDTSAASPSSIAAMARATPPSRDRYIDFLRAFSISIVVLGHWLMAIVTWNVGEFGGSNALDVVPGLWIATWVLQVMPLFFFVGGFSNYVGWMGAQRHGEDYRSFVRSRIQRLMRPTLVFVAVWLAVMAITVATRFGAPLAAASAVVAKPLWFLAVYVLVVALAPAMIALHLRYGARALAILVGSAVLVDGVRVASGMELIGYLNFVFVWLFAHQLGFFYADGRLGRLSKTWYAAIASAALCALVLLTTVGPYSPSLVGATTNKLSNNSPPSVCLVALTIWLVALAMLARPRISRWLQRVRPWAAVIAANSMIMTVFLWHLTALVIAGLILYPLGFPQPSPGSASWWALRPIWIAALAVVLAPLLIAFSRFERPVPRAADERPRHHVERLDKQSLAPVTLLVLGLAGLAQFGFDPSIGRVPLFSSALFNATLVFAAYALLRPTPRYTRQAR